MTTRDSLLKQFGSQEAIAAHYREIGALSKDHPNRAKGRTNTGFQILQETDPERLKEAQSRGGKRGKRGEAKTKEN